MNHTDWKTSVKKLQLLNNLWFVSCQSWRQCGSTRTLEMVPEPKRQEDADWSGFSCKLVEWTKSRWAINVLSFSTRPFLMNLREVFSFWCCFCIEFCHWDAPGCNQGAKHGCWVNNWRRAHLRVNNREQWHETACTTYIQAHDEFSANICFFNIMLRGKHDYMRVNKITHH